MTVRIMRKETKTFITHHESPYNNERDRTLQVEGSGAMVKAACLENRNCKSCVWRAVSSHSSHHPNEVLLVQFSQHVHKVGRKPHSFHYILFIEFGRSVML